MDPYSFNISTASELRLRRHIHEVLLPYARTHLTLDHVAFTEKVVEEVSVTAVLSISRPRTDPNHLASPSNSRVCAHGGSNVVSPTYRAIRGPHAFPAFSRPHPSGREMGYTIGTPQIP